MRQEFFPDGTPIDAWFYQTDIPSPDSLGRPYVLTDYGILSDGKVHTEEIQRLIDRIAEEGGGVLTVPAGVYLSGALFFRQGVQLWVQAGGTLMGSDDISDYPLRDTRIEGENCLYFPALINAEGLNGFTMLGPGTVDGNGLRSWRSFAMRRRWNPACTNKDEHRARLVFLSGCSNVLVAGLRLQNSQFWTNHLYRCDHVRYIGCSIFSPRAPVRAPSTDALDIDACTDVLVKNCRMEVNDDAVVLKGGKGPWADTAPENGANERILVEDCTYGFCHGCLTCGSESIRDRNILVRRIRVDTGYNLLWLKLRPDTPQHYAWITLEDISGRIETFVNVNPWTQFFDLKGRTDLPVSLAEHITLRRCSCDCDIAFHVTPNEEQYLLRDFTLEELKITAVSAGLDMSLLPGSTLRDVRLTVTGDGTEIVEGHAGPE